MCGDGNTRKLWDASALEELEPFEQRYARALLAQHPEDGLAVATTWLSAMGAANTSAMGANPLRIVPRGQTLVRELVRLLCSDDTESANERARISTAVSGGGSVTTATIVATFLSPLVGTMAPLLVVPVAAILYIGANVTGNAWCADNQHFLSESITDADVLRSDREDDFQRTEAGTAPDEEIQN